MGLYILFAYPNVYNKYVIFDLEKFNVHVSISLPTSLYIWHIRSLCNINLLYIHTCKHSVEIVPILSSTFGEDKSCPKIFHAALNMSKWQLEWLERILWKLHWKGNDFFHTSEHVQIPLPILYILLHFCVCFQKGEGQKKLILFQREVFFGRCEHFKIIKTCRNQQSPQLSSSCRSMLLAKACFGSVLGFRNWEDLLLCFQPFDLLST